VPGVRRGVGPGAQPLRAAAGRRCGRRAPGGDPADRPPVLLCCPRLPAQDVCRAGPGPDRPLRAEDPAAGQRAAGHRGRAGRAGGLPAGRRPGRAGEPAGAAAAGHGHPGPGGARPAGARGGRFRDQARPALRHRADRLSDRRPAGPAGRPRRPAARGLAGRASRGGGDLPGPFRRLRRRGPHRGAAGGPGRRPVPPVAEPRQGRRAVRRRAPLLPGRARPRARRRRRARGIRGPGGRRAARAGRQVRRPRPAAPRDRARTAGPGARAPGDRPAPGLGPAHRAALRARRHLAGTGRRTLARTPRQRAGPVQALPGPAHGPGLRQRRPAIPGDPRTRLHRQLLRRPRLPRPAPAR
jgi:hypothetical protein